MKKKTNWKTLVALALGVGTWLKLSEDFAITPPAEICAYPNLGINQINMRLLNLEQDFGEGRITRIYYDAEYAKLRLCRSLL